LSLASVVNRGATIGEGGAPRVAIVRQERRPKVISRLLRWKPLSPTLGKFLGPAFFSTVPLATAGHRNAYDGMGLCGIATPSAIAEARREPNYLGLDGTGRDVCARISKPPPSRRGVSPLRQILHILRGSGFAKRSAISSHCRASALRCRRRTARGSVSAIEWKRAAFMR